MKAVDLAKSSGVGEPMISRYRKGDNVWVSPEDLERLTSAISSDPKEQAELLRAHLLDELHGPAASLINIEIGGRQSLREVPTPYRTINLPADLEQHFETIRAWVVKDADVRNIIEGLGRLLGEDPKTSSSSKASGRKPRKGESQNARIARIVREESDSPRQE